MEDSKLYQAIQSNNAEEVASLLEAGEDANLRDNEGQSLLHVAAKADASSDILKALLPKVDGGLRDIQGQSFADVLESKDKLVEADEIVKLFVKMLTQEGSTEKLEKLILAGWDKWSLSVEDTEESSEEVKDFLGKREEILSKVGQIHHAIEEGRSRDVQNLIDRKMLAQAADRTGLLPLHKAVVFQQPDIVKLLTADFKDVINLTDNMGRTALHYAAGCEDQGNLYTLLKEAGADDSITDLMGKTASDYQEDPQSIAADEVKARVLKIVEAFRPQTTTEAATSVQTADQTPSDAPQTAESEGKDRLSTPPKPVKKGPIRMYIASDIYEKKNVPPPSTVDGKYVAYNLGTALTLALAEIAERRPWDPIEYLAHWLYKYRENVDHTKKQEEMLREIRTEEADQEEEEKARTVRKEEQLRLQEQEETRRRQEEEEERKKKEQEELQRKAKEAAFSQKPQLPTVTEEGEEDSMNKDRDQEGQTELHKLAGQQGADLIALVNMGYSLADRDANNRTPRDIAEENGITENVESLDSYITNLIEQEKLETLQQLILDGYDKLSEVLDQVSTDGLPEQVTDFVQALPDFKDKISKVFKAVQSGVMRDVAQAMERKKLAIAKDVYGRSPLHIAVLSQNMEIVKYIVQNFPITVRCRDNLNRTPLHYATAVSDEISEFLTESGADMQAKDVKERTPAYYKDDKSEIEALKETLESGDSSQPDEADDTEKGETEGQTE